MNSEKVRDATWEDLSRIVEIYNSSIPGRLATSDLEPVTVESRRDGFASHVAARGGQKFSSSTSTACFF